MLSTVPIVCRMALLDLHSECFHIYIFIFCWRRRRTYIWRDLTTLPVCANASHKSASWTIEDLIQDENYKSSIYHLYLEPNSEMPVQCARSHGCSWCVCRECRATRIWFVYFWFFVCLSNVDLTEAIAHKPHVTRSSSAHKCVVFSILWNFVCIAYTTANAITFVWINKCGSISELSINNSEHETESCAVRKCYNSKWCSLADCIYNTKPSISAAV